jgi:N-succinyldiaminopimelate aminotransferase
VNPGLAALQPYPFERLAALLDGVPPGGPVQDLSIGEPRGAVPACVREALVAHLDGLARYPAIAGDSALREACAGWLERRFGLPAGAVDPLRHVLPLAGTREGLFALAQCVVDRTRRDAAVALPNPGYQVYEGAALLAGAQPRYLPLGAQGLPDLDAWEDAQWRGVQLLYLCSPGNPTGAVLTLEHYRRVLALADRHGFVVAGDECYSELYLDESAPPPGLLTACTALGRAGFARCVVLHSLSKRSGVPGLRSGCIAGDADLIAALRRYRSYHGVSLAPPVQVASIAAWSDEAHVAAARARYRATYARVLPLLAPAADVPLPAAAFYLWLPVAGDDAAWVRALYATSGVKLLPGSFLGRPVRGHHPGSGHVRIALVGTADACARALTPVAAALARRP